MKKLYLIRHSKSDWSNPFLDDYNRPLSKRGKENAPFMGKILKEKSIYPDLVLCSPAKRAKKTAKKIVKEINFDKENIHFNNDIYEASCKTLINIIKNIDNRCNIVFLVGHNPGLNMIAYNLVNFDDNIPTSGIVEINVDINSWDELNHSSKAKLISFEYPKKYL